MQTSDFKAAQPLGAGGDAMASAGQGAAVADPMLRAVGWRSLQDKSMIGAWDALAAAVADPNPFYESWFLLPSLEAFDSGETVQILLLERDGILLGLLPVQRQTRYYGNPLPHWRNWLHFNCFLGHPLVIAGFERAFWQAVLAWFDQSGGTQMFLHLSHCPLDGAVHGGLKDELQQQRRPAATVMREERAMLRSDLSPDDYFANSLSTKKRKELRRQQRRLSELGELSIERVTGTTGMPAWSEEFLELEQRSWKGSAGSAMASETQNKALFEQAMLGAARRDRLERLTMRLDGRPIAMLASFLCPPAACAFKTTFDEDFARYSPGVLLQQENLAVLGKADITYSDSCASQDHPMIDHFWRERRDIARHSIAIGGRLRRMAFHLLSRHENGTAPQGIA